MSAQVSAVQAGMGMAVLPHFIARKVNLVCMQQDIGCNQPIWLAIHTDLSHFRRLQVVSEFLTSLVTDNHEWLANGVTF